MSADYTPALWIPTTHHGGWPFAPRYIILHGTAGGSSAQAIAQYFQSNTPPTSTHYVVGVDGTVAQCVSESEPAWGNGVLSAGHDPWWSGNPNAVTFSIEHCKPHTDNSDQLSPAQKAASFALVKHLCEKHGIPMRKADASGGITGHFSIDPVNRKFCPGPYPWDELFAYLNNGGNMSGVPNGWHDDGHFLTAPNDIKLMLGVREFVLAHNWDPANTPMLEEQYTQHCDPMDDKSGEGSQTLFRDCMVIWQKSSGLIWRISLGPVVGRLRQQLAAAQADQGEHQTLLQIKSLVAGVQ